MPTFSDDSGITPIVDTISVGRSDPNVPRTVTQLSTITTGVTLNRTSGTITTVASTLAGAAEVSFVVTNNRVAATDVVICSTTYAGAGLPIVYCSKVLDGSFTITIGNLDAAALNAVLVINFVVIKAS